MFTAETQRSLRGMQVGIQSYKPDPLTDAIIGAAIEVHRALGPGLLESAYEVCLCDELESRHVPFKRQVDLPVVYRDRRLDCGYRMDLIVDSAVIVEIKAIEAFDRIHEAQLLTYLKLSGLTRGLLLNFNVPVLKDGIMRRVLNHTDPISAPSASLR